MIFFLLLIMYTRYEQRKATIESLHTILKKKKKIKINKLSKLFTFKVFVSTKSQ